MKKLNTEKIISNIDSCDRIRGGVIKIDLNPIYTKSLFEINTSIGKLTRSGICARCDAAIYNQGENYYHSTSRGIFKL